MPQAHNLTTKEKVKALLGITDSTDNDILDTLCDAVTAFIEGEAGGQRFKLTTHEEEIHDGENGQWIRLKHRYIYSTPEIKVEYRNGDNTNPDWKEIGKNNYDQYPENGTIYLHNKIDGKRNIKVYYAAGFVAIPHDLEMAASMIVARVYNRRKSQGVGSESYEGVSISWSDAMTDTERAVINRYTRRTFI